MMTLEQTKTSKSSMCRDGSHALCAVDRCGCGCHRGVKPRSRRATPEHNGNGAEPVKPAPLRFQSPVIELVKADSPDRQRKTYGSPKLVELVRPLLEQILVAGEREWYRCVLFPGTRRAGMNCWRLQKRYGSAEWEWRFVPLPEVDQSAIYVRWIGDGQAML
jgi:hypothetical protein